MASRPPAKCDWLLHAALEGPSDVSVVETKGAVNRSHPAGLQRSNKLLPQSSTLLALQKKSNVAPAPTNPHPSQKLFRAAFYKIQVHM